LSFLDGFFLWHRAGLSHRLGDCFRPCAGRHKVPGEKFFAFKNRLAKKVFAGIHFNLVVRWPVAYLAVSGDKDCGWALRMFWFYGKVATKTWRAGSARLFYIIPVILTALVFAGGIFAGLLV